MKSIVKGEQSEEVTVDSGVTQGTVLGQLLFLYHKNLLQITRCNEIFSKTISR